MVNILGRRAEPNGFFQLTPEGQHVLMMKNISKLTPGYTFCDINICGSKVSHHFFIASANRQNLSSQNRIGFVKEINSEYG